MDAGRGGLGAVIEGFFRSRGAPVFHEVSPLADAGMLPLLTGRGYRPVELTSILYQPLERRVAAKAGASVREAGSGEVDLWARTASAAWSDSVDFGGSLLFGVMRTVGSAAGFHMYLVEFEGVPAAAGGLALHGEVALLAGTAPGSGSQRNAERHGFHIAYTRVKWGR